MVGETTIFTPVDMDTPPQNEENHFHEAPVPNDPPLTERVVDEPLQIGEFPEIDEGEVELLLNETNTLAHEVVFVGLCART